MAFDILNLNPFDWEHFQVMEQLQKCNIEHYFVDFFPWGIMWITGCVINSDKEIADALNIPESVVYYDSEHRFVFINLWQLRAMRLGFNLPEDKDDDGDRIF